MDAAVTSLTEPGVRTSPVRRDDPLLGVGAEGARVGDAVPDREIGHSLAEREDLARAFHPGRERKRGRRIEPRPEVDVDVVETDGGLTDAGFAGTRLADRHFLEAHDFGAAGLVDLDGSGHSGFSLKWTGSAPFGERAARREANDRASTGSNAIAGKRGGSSISASRGEVVFRAGCAGWRREPSEERENSL